jgi:hypothetical protein
MLAEDLLIMNNLRLSIVVGAWFQYTDLLLFTKRRLLP